MNLEEIVEKIRASDIPVGILAGAGVILVLLAVKGGKATSKAFFLVIALGLFAGALWWHMQRK